ncbi:NADH-quinone oxidoreductase subunit NuoK, partial [Candidatus Aeolococcus gillhamiae]|uniref:NADH-quinone oxidoreductase subunit NuoK n=1 Tax=Candidatus Aeolococcus gillhamiae TaxID=3127015 RepID=UPI003077FE6C
RAPRGGARAASGKRRWGGPVNVGPAHYAVLSAVLFAIGLFGVTTRRNVIAALASLSVLFSAPLVAAVGFAESGDGSVPRLGDALALFTLAALCAELLVGGAVAALLWRRSDTADLDEMTELDA